MPMLVIQTKQHRQFQLAYWTLVQLAMQGRTAMLRLTEQSCQQPHETATWSQDTVA